MDGWLDGSLSLSLDSIYKSIYVCACVSCALRYVLHFRIKTIPTRWDLNLKIISNYSILLLVFSHQIATHFRLIQSNIYSVVKVLFICKLSIQIVKSVSLKSWNVLFSTHKHTPDWFNANKSVLCQHSNWKWMGNRNKAGTKKQLDIYDYM